MKVSWDDYSQLNGKIKFMFQTTTFSLSCARNVSVTLPVLGRLAPTSDEHLLQSLDGVNEWQAIHCPCLAFEGKWNTLINW